MNRALPICEREPPQQRIILVILDVIGHHCQLSPMSEASVCVDERVVTEGHLEEA